MSQFDFKAIGTTWRINIFQDISPALESDIYKKILDRISDFDKAYSRFRQDSIVKKISEKSGDYVLPPDSVKLFSTYYDLYKKTDGYFTPLIGKMLVDAGYDPVYTLKQKAELSVPPRWEDVMEFKNAVLTVKKPVQLDFGAGGKGYIIDLVGEVIEESNVHSYCINAGGDILYKGDKPIRTGLENPYNTEQVIGVYNLHNMSIAGSSGNRRRWDNFTHIMNPKTKSSATNIAAVWVVSKTAFIADALTTCLYFVDPKVLIRDYQFEYLILYTDNSINRSSNFPAELFTG
jgi:thiamine biosynthesis lipoprotein